MSAEKSKEFQVPEWMHRIMERKMAADHILQKYASQYFGPFTFSGLFRPLKKLLKVSKVSTQAHRKFWKAAEDLFPETQEGTWGYNAKTRIISKAKRKSNSDLN